MRLKVEVAGIVQGVGFRPFVYRTAVQNGLHGYVRNRGDAGVEILVEGDRQAAERFMHDLKEKRPPLARIYSVATTELGGKNEYGSFTIHRSSHETELSGSVIPPDVAVCDDCLKELRTNSDPRHDYFFITCTNCGPRYTTIEKLPYDRENTTMREFPMCSFCSGQYKNPVDRRFHAQTVACPVCGPKAYLTDSSGKPLNYADPTREAGRLISEGSILAVKGYGGFHVSTSTTDERPLTRLREAKHRSQKPLAIMARDLEAARTFARIGKREAELLLSTSRPIVLLNKSPDYCLSDFVAPGLHNIGVMLPYTGLHYMLFDGVRDAAFVMTSANPPNQPIVKDNEEALRMLKGVADYFLFHNRQIAQRCDDSVLRLHGDRTVFLRRSRGYAPAPVTLHRKAERVVLGLGGELNNTACILNSNRAFLSQHVGDVENVETRSFLWEAAQRMIRLTNSKIDAVACDLHPKFATTALAERLAHTGDWELFKVQHHHAHAAALMAEHDLDELVAVCCDGYGYGLDGEAWGGEVLLCTGQKGGFKRVAHLEKHPLVGGDAATRYPLRTAAGTLRGEPQLAEWLMQNSRHFPYGEKEVQIILDQLEEGRDLVQTSSCGRVLDAVAAVLGVCYERTYEGEPSMKLESAAINGKDVLALKPKVAGNVLETTGMVREIFENRSRHHLQDLAYSAHVYVADGLAELAVKAAEENSVGAVGFSGGAACNQILAFAMRKAVKRAGLRFLVHESVPPGDGGLSFGQAAAVGFRMF